MRPLFGYRLWRKMYPLAGINSSSRKVLALGEQAKYTFAINYFTIEVYYGQIYRF